MAGMITTAAGAKFYIGTTKAVPFDTDAAALAVFEAEPWVEVKGIGDFGSMDDETNIVDYPTLGDKYVRKMTGTSNAGDPEVEVGYIADDPGQLALTAARGTKYYYNFKLVLADATSEAEKPTEIYFRAIVATRGRGVGGVEDPMTLTYKLAIWPRPVEVPAAAVAGP